MWFVYTIATTLMWGLAELFYKKGARPDEPFAHLKTGICVGVIMGAHALFVLLTNDFDYDPINILRYLPVSLLYIISMVFSYFGMRFIEESISDPIENTSGALCSLLCVVFLGEKLSFLAVTAIIFIVIGILGIGFLDNSGSTDRKKKIGKKMAVIAFAMPFLYALLDATGSFFDVYYLDDASVSPLIGVTEENIELVANTSYELTFFFCSLIVFVYIKLIGVKFELPRQKDKILAALFETAGQFTYVFAMSGNGAIAAPVISSVCVVSLVLSRIFLNEKLTSKQYLFIFLVIAGIILLSTIN